MTKCHLCWEEMPHADILDHLRLMHPEHYGDGHIDDEIIEADEAAEGMEIARLTITRTLADDDTVDWVTAIDNGGGDLPLTEALGMLRLAEDTLIRERMGDEA